MDHDILYYKYTSVNCGSGYIITTGSLDVPRNLQNIGNWLRGVEPNANIMYKQGPTGVYLYCDRDIIVTDTITGNKYNPLNLSSDTLDRMQIRHMYNSNASVNIVIDRNIIRD